MVKPTTHYYGVCWGKIVKVQKATNPREACKLAFGHIADDMRIKLLADQKNEIGPKRLAEILSTADTWPLLAKGINLSGEFRPAVPASDYWRVR